MKNAIEFGRYIQINRDGIKDPPFAISCDYIFTQLLDRETNN